MRSYLVRRALRIVPLYWVALVVTYLFTGWDSVHGVSGFLENAFFLQVYSRHWVFHGITQAWSLCIEVTFYLLLPVWAAWMRKLDRRRGAGRTIRRRCCAGSCSRSPCFTSPACSSGWWVVAAPTGPTQTARSWLPAWGDHFALGMGLAVVGCVRRARPARCRKVLRWMTKPGADLACWVVAAFTVLVGGHAGRA